MFLKIWKVRGSSFYGLFFCISKGLLSKVGNVLPACQSSPFSVSSHQREALSNYSELHLVPPLLCNYCVFLGQCFKCHLLLFVCLFFPEYEDRCKLRKVKDNILKYISNKYKRIWGKKKTHTRRPKKWEWPLRSTKYHQKQTEQHSTVFLGGLSYYLSFHSIRALL